MSWHKKATEIMLDKNRSVTEKARDYLALLDSRPVYEQTRMLAVLIRTIEQGYSIGYMRFAFVLGMVACVAAQGLLKLLVWVTW